MNDQTSQFLCKLEQLGNVKIEICSSGMFIEAGGIKYQCPTYLNMENRIMDAYIQIYAKWLTKEGHLIKNE